jgi:hypothetical protein
VGTTFAPGTITGFDVYVFSITGQIADQSSANITFASGALPVGSYILATDGTNFVPFTEAGVIETSAGSGGGGLPAPEPATLGLVALAGVALLGSRTRRRS